MTDFVDKAQAWNAMAEKNAEIARLRKALEEINSQSVCACIAKQDECFQMLQNCAEISDAALSSTERHPTEIVEGSQS